MNQTDFTALCTTTLAELQRLLVLKGGEYASFTRPRSTMTVRRR